MSLQHNIAVAFSGLKFNVYSNNKIERYEQAE